MITSTFGYFNVIYAAKFNQERAMKKKLKPKNKFYGKINNYSGGCNGGTFGNQYFAAQIFLCKKRRQLGF